MKPAFVTFGSGKVFVKDVKIIKPMRVDFVSLFIDVVVQTRVFQNNCRAFAKITCIEVAFWVETLSIAIDVMVDPTFCFYSANILLEITTPGIAFFC